MGTSEQSTTIIIYKKGWEYSKTRIAWVVAICIAFKMVELFIVNKFNLKKFKMPLQKLLVIYRVMNKDGTQNNL